MWPFASSTLGRASFILRRLAWAEKKPMAAFLIQHIDDLAAEAASTEVCETCIANNGHVRPSGTVSADRYFCGTCRLRPDEPAEHAA